MKKILLGLLILGSFSAVASFDKVVVAAGKKSCVLNNRDSISTQIRGTKYSVDFQRRGEKLTVRVGEVQNDGTTSTFIHMDEIPVPTEKISFRAGNLMGLGLDKSVNVGIYNITNANAMIQDLFIDAQDCTNNFAN